MEIKKGDYVTRNSYDNDTIFKVINVNNGIYYLKGVEVRLYADSPVDDLKKVENYIEDRFERSKKAENEIIEKDEYFYLPAKILQIDTEFQLNNTLANPYKIRKKSIFENGKIN